MIRVPDSKSMPKFRPLPPIASAPMSRITPDSGEEPLRGAHEVEVCHQWCGACPRRARPGARSGGVRLIVPRTAWVSRTAVRSETSVPMPSTNAKPFTPAVARTKRMNADHERDDVRVDDRREALLVARGDARGHRSAGADLLLDAFEDDDVRVGRDADREDQARDARQRQRDRDELDQRVEVDRRRRAARRPRSRRGSGRRASRKSATIAKPAMPAMRPWSSACLPSVAETCDERDQLELDRQRAGLQQVREALGRAGS